MGQRSFLGEAALRLSRALNLDGLVSPLFEEAQPIVPVVLLADGTDPGMGGNRNRRWAGGMLTATTGNKWMKALDDVIIDEITLLLNAAATPTIHFLGANDADPVVFTLFEYTLLDRAASGNEVAPLTTDGGSGSVGGTAILRPTTATWLPISTLIRIPLAPFLLAAGCKLRFSTATAGASCWFLRGRTF